MALTAAMVINEGTEYEFTVSDTIANLISDGLLTEGNLAPYCYTGFTDSRINALEQIIDFGSSGETVLSYAQAYCNIYPASGTDPIPAGGQQFFWNRSIFNNYAINLYMRNCLVYKGLGAASGFNRNEGRIVLDIKNIKNWYIDYDTNSQLSAVTLTTTAGEGYTGPAYYYGSASNVSPPMCSNNNDPMLNPDCNIYPCNVLIINDELWFGFLNPSCAHYESTLQTGISSCRPGGFLSAASSNGGYLRHDTVGLAYTESSDNYCGFADINEGELPASNAEGIVIGTVYDNYQVLDGVITKASFQYRTDYWNVNTTYCSTVCGNLAVDINTIRTWLSWCGLMFRQANTFYKPIIQGGIIVGYTDDMDAESEYDDMTNVTGNDVPSTPPTPPKPTPGHWDDIDSSGAYENVSNFIRAYYISGTNLQNLRTWMSKTASEGGPPDGYDFMDAIIGIKAYPWALASTATDVVDIVIPNAGNMYMEILQETWIATIAAQMTGQTLPGVPQSMTRHVSTGISAMSTNCSERQYSLGSIDMSQFTNTQYPFLTYDATVELYIPYIGTFVLDTQSVMGRVLSCYLYLDPLTGGVYGYCMCGGTMIASGTGNIAVDVPISANQIGLYQAQKDKLRSQAEVGLITTAATIAAPMIGASVAGTNAAYAVLNQGRGKIAPQTLNNMANSAYNNAYNNAMGRTDISSAAVATTTQALTANRQIKYLAQSHNMSMTGSIGSSVAEWSCPRDAYIKVMRPKPKNPGKNYEHACGVPTYSSGKLSSYKGLTICIDPDVSGVAKATPEERNTIASILQGGVIV